MKFVFDNNILNRITVMVCVTLLGNIFLFLCVKKNCFYDHTLMVRLGNYNNFIATPSFFYTVIRALTKCILRDGKENCARARRDHRTWFRNRRNRRISTGSSGVFSRVVCDFICEPIGPDWRFLRLWKVETGVTSAENAKNLGPESDGGKHRDYLTEKTSGNESGRAQRVEHLSRL